MRQRDLTAHPGQPATELGEVGSHELARRAHSGCAVAFGELARRYRPRLLTVLRRRLSGLPDAEDVVQETLTRAWQKIGFYDDRYQFSTWLYTIALRLATDHQRRERRRGTDVSLQSEPTETGSTEPSLHVREEAGNLWAIAHAVLNDAQYTALWLRYGEGLNVNEVAHATGRTAVGTRVLLHRARKRLQQYACPQRSDQSGALP